MKSSLLAGLDGEATNSEQRRLEGVEFLLFSGEYKPSAVSMRRLLGLRRAALGLSGRLEEVLCSIGRNESSGRSLRGCRTGIFVDGVEKIDEVVDKGEIQLSSRIVTHVTRFSVTYRTCLSEASLSLRGRNAHSAAISNGIEVACYYASTVRLHFFHMMHFMIVQHHSKGISGCAAVKEQLEMADACHQFLFCAWVV